MGNKPTLRVHLMSNMGTRKVINLFLFTLTFACITHISCLESVNRPNYGVIFTPVTQLQNSGSFWRNYIQLQNFTDQLIPNFVRTHASETFLCNLEYQGNDTSSTYKTLALKTMKAICVTLSPSLSAFNLQKQKLINDIDTSQMTIQQLMKGTQLAKTKRNAPFDFVSSLGKSLFGLSKHSDLLHLHENLQNLKFQTNTSLGRIQRHSNLLQSVVNIQNDRINKAKLSIIDNELRINSTLNNIQDIEVYMNEQFSNLQDEAQITHNILKFQTRLMAQLFDNGVAQVNSLQLIKHELNSFEKALHDLSNGILSPAIIQPTKLQSTLDQIQNSLQTTHPEFNIATNDYNFYYSYKVNVIKINNNFVIELNVPLTTSATHFTVYAANSLRLPISTERNSRNKYDYTEITGISPYLAISHDKEFYIEMSDFQLANCIGDRDYKICKSALLQFTNSKESCLQALFYNNQDMIRNVCKFNYYEESIPRDSYFPLGNGKILVTAVDRQWTVSCSKRAPTIINSCKFCVIQLGCSCSLSSLYSYIPPSLENCHDTQSKPVSFPINLLAFFSMIPKSQKINITGSSLFETEQNVHLPHFNLREMDTQSIVKQNDESAMDLQKILTLAGEKQTFYLSKADRLYSSNNQLNQALRSNLGGIISLLYYILSTFGIILTLYCIYKIQALYAILAVLKIAEAHGHHLLQNTVHSLQNNENTGQNVYEVPLRNLPVITILTVIGLYLIWKIIQCIYFKLVIQQLVTVRSTPPNKNYSTHVYLLVTNGIFSLNIYVCTINITPTDVVLSKSMDGVGLKHYPTCSNLQGKLKIFWRGLELVHTNTGLKVPLPKFITLHFKQNTKLKTIIQSKYTVRMFLGQNNIYREPEVKSNFKLHTKSDIQLKVTKDSSQKEHSLEESDY